MLFMFLLWFRALGDRGRPGEMQGVFLLLWRRLTGHGDLYAVLDVDHSAADG
jgi:hypothetical protein